MTHPVLAYFSFVVVLVRVIARTRARNRNRARNYRSSRESQESAMDTPGLAAREPDIDARRPESANPSLSMPAHARGAGDCRHKSLEERSINKTGDR
jgi:hypothetical protein